MDLSTIPTQQDESRIVRVSFSLPASQAPTKKGLINQADAHIVLAAPLAHCTVKIGAIMRQQDGGLTLMLASSFGAGVQPKVYRNEDGDVVTSGRGKLELVGLTDAVIDAYRDAVKHTPDAVFNGTHEAIVTA